MTRWPAGPITCRPGPPRPTIFLDRDGVIVVERDYLSDPDEVTLERGVGEALVLARNRGFQLVGLSNQSGLGRGRFGPAELAAVMTRLDELLTRAGCPLDGFFYCPHAPTDGCDCRKPALGLLEEAACELTWDPTRSWVIGDKRSDVALAEAAGLRGILVRTGHGRNQEAGLGAGESVLVLDDLPAAVAHILEQTP